MQSQATAFPFPAFWDDVRRKTRPKPLTVAPTHTARFDFRAGLCRFQWIRCQEQHVLARVALRDVFPCGGVYISCRLSVDPSLHVLNKNNMQIYERGVWATHKPSKTCYVPKGSCLMIRSPANALNSGDPQNRLPTACERVGLRQHVLHADQPLHLAEGGQIAHEGLANRRGIRKKGRDQGMMAKPRQKRPTIETSVSRFCVFLVVDCVS